MTLNTSLLWQVLQMHGHKNGLKRSRGGHFEGGGYEKSPKRSRAFA